MMPRQPVEVRASVFRCQIQLDPGDSRVGKMRKSAENLSTLLDYREGSFF